MFIVYLYSFIWRFSEIWVPPVLIHLYMGFSILNHPFGGTPMTIEPPILIIINHFQPSLTINKPFWGTPMTMKTPYSIITRKILLVGKAFCSPRWPFGGFALNYLVAGKGQHPCREGRNGVDVHANKMFTCVFYTHTYRYVFIDTYTTCSHRCVCVCMYTDRLIDIQTKIDR